MKNKGWRNESRRHALASKGIKTAQKMPNVIKSRKTWEKDKKFMEEQARQEYQKLKDEYRILLNQDIEDYKIGIKNVRIKKRMAEIEDYFNNSEEKFFTASDLRKIARYTDVNNNDASYIFIAKKIKSPLLKQFQEIQEENEKAGYLKNPERRYKLYNQLRDEFMATHPKEAEEVFKRT